MDLPAREKDYGAFYVPAFQVKVGGQDLVRELYLTVTGIEVDLPEKSPGRFSFSVANSFDWKAREFLARQREEPVNLIELFAFGSPVEVRLGYGESARLQPMLQGLITEISTSFREGGTPELTISGYDKLYPLTTGNHTRNWERRRDSDVVKEVIASLGVKGTVVQTDPVKPRIDQSQQSDIDFLDKLAKRNGFTFKLRNTDFYFGPRQNDRGKIIELAWGKGLLSFSPEANLARQITRVEVRGRSAQTGEAIVGRAGRGDESGRDTRREGGPDRVTQALGNERVMSIRAEVHTQAEADERARAILEERALEFVTGDGECIGLPEIVPDINIGLQELGSAFSKTYYVHEATHRVDGNGYRTTFKVKESNV
jgi:phage protein D